MGRQRHMSERMERQGDRKGDVYREIDRHIESHRDSIDRSVYRLHSYFCSCCTILEYTYVCHAGSVFGTT